MLISEQWLREWIDPALDTEGLAERLTMGGLEVAAVTPAGPALPKVVVGRITSVAPHPRRKKLKVCGVDVGGRSELQIVCGAPNVTTGMFAPTALSGAVLGGKTIRRTEIDGVASQGMLCSAAELELGDDASGLLELDSDGIPGRSLAETLRLEDQVIEVELTPNRGDCLSVLGVARELSLLCDVPLRQRDVPGWAAESNAAIPISIDSPTLCPRYVGRVLDGVDCGATTPIWIRERLRRCGVRPISAVVDVTNYVMLELGQPMHAFDREKLTGGIVVRQAQRGEQIELLDGSVHELDDETLLITDATGPIALAGIMGGSDSAISDGTHSIVLEAAHFSAEPLAGQARRYGLHTDASHRFERGVDAQLPAVASHYATALLQGITGGVAGPIIEAVHRRELPKRRPVPVRLSRIRRLLGVDLGEAKVNTILSRVGSQNTKNTGRDDVRWQVKPPSYRFDIGREADLIEEVARVSGYDQLPSRNPRLHVVGIRAAERDLDPDQLKWALIDRGYREAITYSFVDPELQSRLFPDEPPIPLVNALAPGMSVMRTSLLPGLLEALMTNFNRQHRRVRLFEVGKTFHSNAGKVVEVERLSGVISGSVQPEQWGDTLRTVDFFDLKSDVEALLAAGGGPNTERFEPAENALLHPGQNAVVTRDAEAVGYLGRLHPDQQRALDLAHEVFVFELETSALTRGTIPEYQGISRFPAIRRDLAVVVDEAVTAREILDSVRVCAGEYLTNLELFDVFQREGLDSKTKSLAFSLTLQSSSRTLIDSEVESIVDKTLNELRDRFGAKLRT